jgi:hypothetical protein
MPVPLENAVALGRIGGPLLAENLVRKNTGLGEENLAFHNTSDTDNILFLNVIDNLLKNGDCFELIDGENLEFKGEFIKNVIESSKRDLVMVVCVIGPQSSGKSTLMNFAFGT